MLWLHIVGNGRETYHPNNSAGKSLHHAAREESKFYVMASVHWNTSRERYDNLLDVARAMKTVLTSARAKALSNQAFLVPVLSAKYPTGTQETTEIPALKERRIKL